MRRGCLQCDDCYGLVQSRRDQIKENVEKFGQDLQSIHENPVKIDDEKFNSGIAETAKNVDALWIRSNSTTSEFYTVL